MGVQNSEALAAPIMERMVGRFLDCVVFAFLTYTLVVFSVASRWHASSLFSMSGGYTMKKYPSRGPCRRRNC